METPVLRELLPAVTSTKTESRKTKQEVGHRVIRQPHHYQSGMVALHETQYFQKSTELLLHNLPFQKVCREILNRERNGWHMQGYTLQEASEAYLVGLLEGASLWANHAKWITIMWKDIQLACHIFGECDLCFISVHLSVLPVCLGDDWVHMSVLMERN